MVWGMGSRTFALVAALAAGAALLVPKMAETMLPKMLMGFLLLDSRRDGRTAAWGKTTERKRAG